MAIVFCALTLSIPRGFEPYALATEDAHPMRMSSSNHAVRALGFHSAMGNHDCGRGCRMVFLKGCVCAPPPPHPSPPPPPPPKPPPPDMVSSELVCDEGDTGSLIHYCQKACREIDGSNIGICAPGLIPGRLSEQDESAPDSWTWGKTCHPPDDGRFTELEPAWLGNWAYDLRRQAQYGEADFVGSECTEGLKWSCVFFGVETCSDAPGAYNHSQCHWPEKSPLALKLSKKLDTVSTGIHSQDVQDALSLQCLHPPFVYAATRSSATGTPNSIGASLGKDGADQLLCGYPEADRYKAMLSPRDTECTRAWTPPVTVTNALNDLMSNKLTSIFSRQSTAGSPLSALTIGDVSVTCLNGVKDEFSHDDDPHWTSSQIGAGFAMHGFAMNIMYDPIEGRTPDEIKDSINEMKKEGQPFFMYEARCVYAATREPRVLYTQADDGMNEGPVFLDRQTIQCNFDEVLTSFQLQQNLGSGKVRYAYQCAKSDVYTGAPVVLQSSCENLQEREVGLLSHFDIIECDEDGALQKIVLRTADQDGVFGCRRGESIYEFTCVPRGMHLHSPPSSPAPCAPASTDWSEPPLILKQPPSAILYHAPKNVDEELDIWYEECADVFFNELNVANYDWAPVVAHASMPEFLPATLTAVQRFVSSTTAKGSQLDRAITMMTSLTDELLISVPNIDKATPTKALVVRTTIAYKESLTTQKHMNEAADKCRTSEESGCSSLVIPTFTVGKSVDDLQNYLGSNTQDPSSLTGLATHFQNVRDKNQLWDKFKEVYTLHDADAVERRTGLDAQKQALINELQNSVFTTLSAANTGMKNEQDDMKSTLTSLKSDLDKWMTSQIISTIMNLLMGAVSFVGSLDARYEAGESLFGYKGSPAEVEELLQQDKENGNVAKWTAKITTATQNGAAPDEINELERQKKLIEKTNDAARKMRQITNLKNFELPKVLYVGGQILSQSLSCGCTDLPSIPTKNKDYKAAMKDKKFHAFCTATTKVFKPNSACTLAKQSMKMAKEISPPASEGGTIDALGQLIGSYNGAFDYSTTAKASDAMTETLDDLASKLSELTSGHWEDYAAQQMEIVSSYYTGEIGGASVAADARNYMAKVTSYTSYGKDYVAAANRYLSLMRSVQVINAQIEANDLVRDAVKDATDANFNEQEQQKWLLRLLSIKITNVASVVYSTMNQVCNSLSYQMPSTYFMCMDPAHVSSANAVADFCGAFDPKLESKFFPFKPFEVKASGEPTLVSGEGAVYKYLDGFYQKFKDFRKLATFLRSSTQGQGHGQEPKQFTVRLQVDPGPPALEAEDDEQKWHYEVCLIADMDFGECASLPDGNDCYDSVDTGAMCPTLQANNAESGGYACCHFRAKSTKESMSHVHVPPDRLYVTADAWQRFLDGNEWREHELDFEVTSKSFLGLQYNQGDTIDGAFSSIFFRGFMAYVDGLALPCEQVTARLTPDLRHPMAQRYCDYQHSTQQCPTVQKDFLPQESGSSSAQASLNVLHTAGFDYKMPVPIYDGKTMCTGSDTKAHVFDDNSVQLCKHPDGHELCKEAKPKYCLLNGKYTDSLNYLVQDNDWVQSNQPLALPSLLTKWTFSVQLSNYGPGDPADFSQRLGELRDCGKYHTPGSKCSNVYLTFFTTVQNEGSNVQCYHGACTPACGLGE